MGMKLKSEGVAGHGMDGTEARRALAVLADPGAALELRGLPRGCSVTVTGDLSNLNQALAALAPDRNVYYTINPVPLDHAGGSRNLHILRRRWLLIDIDPVKDTAHKDDPATENEKAAAFALADEIKDELLHRNWPLPVVIDSGNGCHLLYRIDMPNDDVAAALCRAVLLALHRAYSGSRGTVDKSVHNAARIAKLPGSIARKGTCSPGRDYRPCRLVSVPQEIEVVTPEQLQQLVDDAIRADQAMRTAPAILPAEPDPVPIVVAATASQEGGWKIAPPDLSRLSAYVRAAVDAEVAAVTNAAPGGAEGRNNTLNKAAFALGQFVGAGVLNEGEVQLLLEHAAERCGLFSDPNCGPVGVRRTIDSGLYAGRAQPRDLNELRPQTNGRHPSIPAAPASTPPRARPKIWSAEELMRAELPEPRWAVPGLLCEGLNLLGGKPKQGKSFLALNLALTVAAGGMALGNLPVEASHVLYLSLEDKERRLKDRMRIMLRGTELQTAGRLHLVTSWPRMGDGGMEELASWADTFPAGSIGLVIIDVLKKFRAPAGRTRGTAYDEDYESLAGLKAFADDRRINMLVLHHLKKAKAEDAIDDVSGSAGITGTCDGILVLTRDRGDDEGELYVTGRDVEEQRLAIRFERKTCTWISLGDADKHVTSVIGGKLVSHLKANPNTWFYPAALAEAVEEDAAKVRTTLTRLHKDGLAARKNHQYRWPGPPPGEVLDDPI